MSDFDPIVYTLYNVVKPSQNKKGRKFFPAALFFEYFFSAAGKKFGPSYFDPALVIFTTGCDFLFKSILGHCVIKLSTFFPG